MNKHLVTVEGKTFLMVRNLQQCQAQGGTAVRLDCLGLKVKSIERERERYDKRHTMGERTRVEYSVMTEYSRAV